MGYLLGSFYGIKDFLKTRKIPKQKINLARINIGAFFIPKSNLGRWLPVFLWAVVIFIFSSIPQITTSQFFSFDFILKKTAHVAEYAIFYVLLVRATGAKLATSMLLVMLYALSDEFHQSLVPGRTAAIYDLGFDLSGASIAAYSLWKSKLNLLLKP